MALLDNPQAEVAAAPALAAIKVAKTPNGTHVITTGDDKKLKVWVVEGLKLLTQR